MSISVSPQERVVYRMLPYALVWPVLFLAGEHLFAPAVGSALSGFLWVLGAWFVAPRAARRLSLPAWLGVSLIFAFAAFALRLGIERLFASA